MISSEEAAAIKLYKSYARKHLPSAETLAGLWAADFDGEGIDELRVYLDKLQKYTRVVRRAAQLRQDHYIEFLRKFDREDDGHRWWRLGMNKLAEDAQEKLEYWTNVHERKFDQLARRRQKVPSFVYVVRNVDYDPMEKKKWEKVVQRPTLSKKEKQRRKRERQRAKKEADMKLLETTIEEKKRDTNVFLRFLQDVGSLEGNGILDCNEIVAALKSPRKDCVAFIAKTRRNVHLKFKMGTTRADFNRMAQAFLTVDVTCLDQSKNAADLLELIALYDYGTLLSAILLHGSCEDHVVKFCVCSLMGWCPQTKFHKWRKWYIRELIRLKVPVENIGFIIANCTKIATLYIIRTLRHELENQSMPLCENTISALKPLETRCRRYRVYNQYVTTTNHNENNSEHVRLFNLWLKKNNRI